MKTIRLPVSKLSVLTSHAVLLCWCPSRSNLDNHNGVNITIYTNICVNNSSHLEICKFLLIIYSDLDQIWFRFRGALYTIMKCHRLSLTPWRSLLAFNKYTVLLEIYAAVFYPWFARSGLSEISTGTYILLIR